ncbi:MAG: alpha/beta hydrolase family protein [Candidatus Bipolaricaulia bacterium]
MRFEGGDGLTLAGTLTVPTTTDVEPPVVVMLHGSGPIDRDGNAPGLALDVFRQLADPLAQNGIASLRYDKRGVGKSEGSFDAACMSDLVADARSAVQFVKARPEINSEQVFVLGHSEGGTLAQIVATRASLAGLILIAAPAQPLGKVITWQLQQTLKEQGAPDSQIESELNKQRRFNKWVKRTEGKWGNYTLKDVQDAVPGFTAREWLSAQSFPLCWYREHFNHDPLSTIRNIEVPVLIVHGQNDRQVPPPAAHSLAQAGKDAGNDDVQARVFSNLNHVLRRDQDKALGNRHLDRPVDERVRQLIVGWLTEQTR